MKYILSFSIVMMLSIGSIMSQSTQVYETKIVGGKAYTVYPIKSGDTWQSIADEFSISIDALYNANPKVKEDLKGTKKLLIPHAEKKQSIKVETNINIDNSDTDSFVLPYTGDTTVRKLGEPEKKVVKTERAKVYGEELRTEFRGANSLIVYKIGKNDNIKDVASHYYCSIAEILEINPNANPQLEPGKIIKIPVRREQVVAFEEVAELTNKNTISTDSSEETPKVEPTINQDIKSIVNTAKNDSLSKEDDKKLQKNETIEDTSIGEDDIVEENLGPNESRLGDYIVLKRSGKLFIKHTVISGEDLTRIARTNYSSNSRILAANGLNSSKVTTGQILLIPTTKEILKKLTGLNYGQRTKNTIAKKAPKITKDKKSKTEKIEKIAKVKKSPKVKTIKPAAETTVEVAATNTFNGFKWGDVINPSNDRLEDSARKTITDNVKDFNIKEVHANASEGETKETYTHTVLKGETMESIAKKYKVAPSDIANWNNLYQERVRVGQDLIVNAKRAAKPYLAINSITPEQKVQIKQNDKSNKILSVQENGLCILTDNPIFTGILHKTAPVGTLLYVTNLDNFKKIYVRVTGTLSEKEEADVILRIDRETANHLLVNTPLTNVSITYGIVD
jgi:LysM repeat protein